MTRLIVVSAVAALMAACPESALVGAPRLALQYDPSYPETFDDVQLYWMHPVGEASGGYAVEMRKVPEPFQTVKSVPYNVESLKFVFDAQAAEVSDFEFRVRALPEDGELRASNAIRIHRGVRAPRFSCFGACQPVNGGFPLQWTNRSSVADGLILERTLERIDGRSVMPSVQLPVSSTSYVDADIAPWQDGATIEYRLIALRGSERSAPSIFRSRAAPPLPPAAVTATLIPGAVRVSYQNRSAIVRRMGIRKYLLGTWSFVGAPSAPPPGSFGSFDDPVDAAFSGWPLIFTYGVSAGEEGFESAPETATVLSLPGPTDGLLNDLAWLPPGVFAARSPSGWTTAGTLRDPNGWTSATVMPFLIAAGDDFSKAFLASPGASILRPGVVLDSAGYAHAVYAEPVAETPGSSAIVHAWHDDAGWHREEITRRAFASSFAPRARVEIGLDGTLFASWNSLSELGAAKRVAGVWQIQDVAAALGSALQVYDGFSSHFLAGDEFGNAHLFLRDFSGYGYHLFQDDTGWHSDGRMGPYFGSSDENMRVLCGRGRVVFAYHSFDASGNSISVSERTPTGWTAPVKLGPLGVASNSPWDFRLEMTRTADGQLIAIAARTTDPKQLGAVWARSDAWTKVASWYAVPPDFALGFGPDGKLWLSSGLQDLSPSRGLVPTVLYEQY